MTGDASPGRDEAPEVDEAVRRALVEGRGHLLRLLRGRLGSPDEAEEVFQRFVVRALQAAGGIRDAGNVRAWLDRVLASTLADYWRATARQRRLASALEASGGLGETIDAEIDGAVCQCLHDLLPTLRSDYAEALRRVDLRGETRAAVAADLGIGAGNLAVRLHRARQALKRRLEEMCRTCTTHGFLDCGCEQGRRLASLRAGAAGRDA
jgi:RNA polymerase sigma factor (sigma-70 family)